MRRNANEAPFRHHFKLSFKNIKLNFLIIQNEYEETTRGSLSLSVSFWLQWSADTLRVGLTNLVNSDASGNIFIPLKYTQHHHPRMWRERTAELWAAWIPVAKPMLSAWDHDHWKRFFIAYAVQEQKKIETMDQCVFVYTI